MRKRTHPVERTFNPIIQIKKAKHHGNIDSRTD